MKEAVKLTTVHNTGHKVKNKEFKEPRSYDVLSCLTKNSWRVQIEAKNPRQAFKQTKIVYGELLKMMKDEPLLVYTTVNKRGIVDLKNGWKSIR